MGLGNPMSRKGGETWGTLECGGRDLEIEIKSKIKNESKNKIKNKIKNKSKSKNESKNKNNGSGQECPLHIVVCSTLLHIVEVVGFRGTVTNVHCSLVKATLIIFEHHPSKARTTVFFACLRPAPN
jgi:hypothetical protein